MAENDEELEARIAAGERKAAERRRREEAEGRAEDRRRSAAAVEQRRINEERSRWRRAYDEAVEHSKKAAERADRARDEAKKAPKLLDEAKKLRDRAATAAEYAPDRARRYLNQARQKEAEARQLNDAVPAARRVYEEASAYREAVYAGRQAIKAGRKADMPRPPAALREPVASAPTTTTTAAPDEIEEEEGPRSRPRPGVEQEKDTDGRVPAGEAKPAKPTEVDPAIAALAEANGISPDVVQGMIGGGPGSDDNDLPVYYGTHDSKGRKRRDNPIVATSEIEEAPFRWDARDLDAFQRRMFAAGLYGSASIEDIPFGTVDGITLEAWKGLVTTAARYYKAGKKITPQMVLDMLPKRPNGGGAADPPVSVTNSNDLRLKLRAAAKEILGTQNIDDAAVDRMIAAYQAEERRGGASQSSMDAESFEGFAEREITKLDPIKAGARSTVRVADTLRQMMQGSELNVSGGS